MTTITERVVAGARFLDEHDPDWWRADVERAIDLDALDLHQTESCVLGQRCPLTVLSSYTRTAVDELSAFDFSSAYHAYAQHLSDLHGWRLLEWASRHGFITDDEDAENWADLTAEWKRVITERRAAS